MYYTCVHNKSSLLKCNCNLLTGHGEPPMNIKLIEKTDLNLDREKLRSTSNHFHIDCDVHSKYTRLPSDGIMKHPR